MATYLSLTPATAKLYDRDGMLLTTCGLVTLLPTLHEFAGAEVTVAAREPMALDLGGGWRSTGWASGSRTGNVTCTLTRVG